MSTITGTPGSETLNGSVDDDTVMGLVGGNDSPTSSEVRTPSPAADIPKHMAAIAAVNAGPVVDLNGAGSGIHMALQYTEGSAPIAIAPDATVVDVDSSDFNGGTLTVRFMSQGTASDQLTIQNQGTAPGQIGISGADVQFGGVTIGTFTGGTNGTSLVVTFNGSSATPAAAQALINHVLFSNSSDTPSDATRTVIFSLADGDGGTNDNGGADADGNGQPDGGTTGAINVTATNDAPVVDLNGASPGSSSTLAYTAGGAAVAIAPAATVIDADSTNFNTGTLTVGFTLNGTATDQLTIQNQGTSAGLIGISGSNVQFGGVTIGTFSGGANGSNLVVRFTSGSATPAAARALVDHILFSNTAADPSSLARTVVFTLVDGDGTSNGGTDSGTATATVTVTVPNHAPTLANLIADQPAVEDSAFSFQFAANSFSDVDAGDSLTYSATLPDGTPLPAWLTFTAATGTFSGTPLNDDVGSISVKVTATDSSAATASDTFGIAVANTNDAPVANADTLSAGEGTPVTYRAVQLLGNDTDVDGDTLTIASVTSGTGGTAVLNGDGTVTFTPAADFTGAASFSYTANDGTVDSNSAAVTVNVGPTSTITVSDSSLIAGETALVTITFSDAVTGLTNSDLTVGNGTLSAVTSSDGGITWTATLTPVNGKSVSSNVITLANGSVTDLAGNMNTGPAGTSGIVISNGFGNNVGVLASDGAGGFEAVASFGSGGSFPSSVTLGDVNGDGAIDIVATNLGSNTVALLEADGAGGFASAVTFGSGGAGPISVALGDVSGDGILDIVTSHQDSNTVGVLVGDGTGGFASAVAYVSGTSNPVSVALGDVNGDGYLDIVTGNFGNNTIGWLAGNGAGAFGSASTFGSGGSGPSSVALGDVNDDGFLDIVVANTFSQNVGVLAGDGAGGFAAAVTYGSGGVYPYSVALGDVDGDGFLDIVAANFLSKNVGVLAGDGPGSFAPVVVYAIGSDSPNFVALGDVNTDGYLDIVTANSSGDYVGILAGNGSGGFDTAIFKNSGGSYPYAVALYSTPGGTDSNSYDVDTVRPAATVTVSNTSLTIGDTALVTIVFSEPVTGFDNSDLSVADGTLSPVSSSDGGITWTATLTPNGGTTASGDVITLHDASVTDLPGNSNSGTTSSNAYAIDTVAPSVSVSIDESLLSDGNSSAVVTFAFSEAPGASFTESDIQASAGLSVDAGSLNQVDATHYTTTVTADANYDGTGTVSVAGAAFFDAAGNAGTDGSDVVDIDTVNPTATITVSDSLLTSGETALVTIAFSEPVTGFSNADLSVGNGTLSTVTSSDGGVTWTATLTPVGGTSASGNVITLAGGSVTDLAGNANTSLSGIFVANTYSNTVGVLASDGSGGFAAVVTYGSGGSSPTAMALGDVNGDGLLDIVTANVNSSTVGILVGNAAGGFAPAVSHGSGASLPTALALGDVNDDGFVDIVTSSIYGTNIGVLAGDGAGDFAAAVTYGNGSQPYSVALGDVTGNGFVDIVTANEYSHNVSVLAGDGTGGFAAAVFYGVGATNPTSIALGDLNGDGFLDIATANLDNSVSVLAGNGTGGFTAAVTHDSGGSYPTSIALGDVNGDGFLDIAVAYSLFTGTVGVLAGDGTGGFAPAVTYDTGGYYPNSIALGDVNGDGFLDLATTNGSSGTVAVLAGNGTGGFATAVTYNSGGTYPVSVALYTITGTDSNSYAVDTQSAPVLDNATSPSFPTILENAADPAGVTIASLVIDGSVTDADGDPVEAIAITALDTSLGAWQYSTDSGANWLTIDANHINSATNELALLLGPTAMLRLLPFGDLNGSLASAITFRAWDQSSGSSGQYAVIAATGDSTAFSTASATAGITVTAVNDAPTFSAGTGKLIQPVGASDDVGYSVVVQPDGKIVVGGRSYNGTDYDFSLVRFNADGSLDGSFATGGTLIVPVGSGLDSGNMVTLQSDGKIVLAGYSFNGAASQDFSIIRVDANGTLDNTFSGDGKLIISIVPGDQDYAQSVVIQPDGKIILAGDSFVPGRYAFSLVRLNADGSLDSTFDGDGKIIVAGPVSTDLGYSAIVQPDGKIVLAGYSSTDATFRDFSIIRLNANGSLDTTFDTDGRLLVPVNFGDDFAYSIAIQPDGKLVVAGASYNGIFEFSVIRLNVNGSLDNSFDGDGKRLVQVGAGTAFANSVTVQADGKILLAGYTFNGTGNDFALVRLNANGSLDTTFDTDGKLVVPVGSANNAGYSVVVQPDGKIVVSGVSFNGATNDVSVIRLNADGSLDTTFGASTDTLGGTVSYTENAAAVALDASVLVLDIELAALNGGLGNYSGATLTLGRSGGADAEDLFSGRGNLASLAAASGNVVLSAVTVGTYTNTGGQLTITFNGNATQARVNEVLSSIGYANSSEEPSASITIDYAFSDGDAGETAGTATVNITAVNDAPAGTDNSVTAVESVPCVFAEEDFGFSDVDNDDFVSVQITTLPVGGILTNNGAAITAGDFVSVSSINAGELVFTPAADGAGSTGFTFQVRDGGGTAPGVDTDPSANTLTIEVTAADDQPSGQPATHVDGTPGPLERQTLTAQIGDLADADGLSDPLTWIYNWYRDGQLVFNSAPGVATYTLQHADVDHHMTVSVTYTDLNGFTDTSAESAPSVLIGRWAALGYGAGNGNDSIIGGIANDSLNGGLGNDTLFGGDGNDTLEGGNGNDSYYVNSLDDIVTETGTGSADKIYTTVTYTMGSGVEILYLLNSASIDATGNASNNSIYGNSGNNALTGGAGNDTMLGIDGDDTLDGGIGRDSMVGGGGNDTYYVDQATDVVFESGAGTDTVHATVSYTMAGNVEVLILDGLAANGTGNASGNTMNGNALANTLSGLAGSDVLVGNDGNDTLIGGAFADTLMGGLGADRFKYATVAESANSANARDTISDFSAQEGDLIDLSAIDAKPSVTGNDAFIFVGVDVAFTTANANGGLRFDSQSNTLYGSNDADVDAEFAIVLTGVASVSGGSIVL